MSSLLGSNVSVPYSAPWVTSWNRYSTQILTFAGAPDIARNITVPAGQWWRVVWMQCQSVTSAVVANRLVVAEFNPPGNGVLTIPAPAVQAASTTVLYAFGIGMTAYAPGVVATEGVQSAGVVDMLWSPKTIITMGYFNNQTGDLIINAATVAVEIYTEATDDTTGTPILIPTPTLT